MGLLDHKAVDVTLKIRALKENPETVSVLYFDRVDDVAVLEELSFDFDDFEALGRNSSVVMLLNNFGILVSDCIQRFVPINFKKRNPTQPWTTRGILKFARNLKRNQKLRYSANPVDLNWVES